MKCGKFLAHPGQLLLTVKETGLTTGLRPRRLPLLTCKKCQGPRCIARLLRAWLCRFELSRYGSNCRLGNFTGVKTMLSLGKHHQSCSKRTKTLRCGRKRSSRRVDFRRKFYYLTTRTFRK